MPQARGTRFRYTRQTAAIVAVMGGMPGFCGARDIHGALRGGGQPVGLATVYRHLHVLAERGEVDQVHTASGESRYRLRASSTTCHLTCRACGCIVEADASEVRDWARQVAAAAGFTLTGYTAGLTGLCPAHGGGSPAAAAQPDATSAPPGSPPARTGA